MGSIGHATALALAREGVNVVVTGTGRDPTTFPEEEKAAGWQDIDSVAAEVCRFGAKALALIVDVRDPDAVEALVARATRELGGVDILVNNAAAAKGDDRVPFVDLDNELWRKIMDVNLTGAYYAAKYVARQMIGQGRGGRIINISSINGQRALANTGAYAVSKGAIIDLNRYFAIELAPHGINVNCVAPGITATSRIADVVEEVRQSPELLREIPLGRLGTSAEIAEAVLFFADGRSSYITGQTLNVDGGVWMD